MGETGERMPSEGGPAAQVVATDAHEAKKARIMEACYDCYAEHGLNGVGIKGLAEACGISSGNLYHYFDNLDDLIVQSTEHCMSKVEDDFMAIAPKSPDDVERFIDRLPYWTAERHGKKYRLMYQVYTHPKYREYGQRFFAGVDRRYTEYARQLEAQVGIPYQDMVSMIFVLIRACVHYALFEDEYYLQAELSFLKRGIAAYRARLAAGDPLGAAVGGTAGSGPNTPASGHAAEE